MGLAGKVTGAKIIDAAGKETDDYGWAYHYSLGALRHDRGQRNSLPSKDDDADKVV